MTDRPRFVIRDSRYTTARTRIVTVRELDTDRLLTLTAKFPDDSDAAIFEQAAAHMDTGLVNRRANRA